MVTARTWGEAKQISRGLKKSKKAVVDSDFEENVDLEFQRIKKMYPKKTRPIFPCEAKQEACRLSNLADGLDWGWGDVHKENADGGQYWTIVGGKIYLPKKQR